MLVRSPLVAQLVLLCGSLIQHVTLAPAQLALTAGHPLTRPLDNIPEVSPIQKRHNWASAGSG